MAQVLHIIQKDVRHLWPPALVVLLLMAVHAYLEFRIFPGPDQPLSNILSVPLPLGVAFLIGRLIFQEALPGDRQFWLTRPYGWSKLLAAKVLFVVLLINVPLFASDCYILAAQGFPVVSVFPELLLRQLFMTTLFILPAFAIATLTTGVSQFLLAWFILLLVPLCESTLQSIWSRGRNILYYDGGPLFIPIMTVTAFGVIVWQYARRRTAAARWAVFAIACVFVPVTEGVSHLAHPSDAASQISRLPNQSDVRVGIDPGRRIPSQAAWSLPHQGSFNLRIPLTAAGVPPRTLLRGNGTMVFDFGGAAWPRPGGPLPVGVQRIDGGYWLTANLEDSSYGILKKQTVNIHAVLGMEVVNDEVKTRVPLTTSSVLIPDLGLCHIFQFLFQQVRLTCRAGLGPSLETDVRLDSPGPEGGIIVTFPPHEIPWGLSPASDLGFVTSFRVTPGFEYSFIPRRKIAKFQSTLDLNSIDLANYTLPRIDN